MDHKKGRLRPISREVLFLMIFHDDPKFHYTPKYMKEPMLEWLSVAYPELADFIKSDGPVDEERKHLLCDILCSIQEKAIKFMEEHEQCQKTPGHT